MLLREQLLTKTLPPPRHRLAARLRPLTLLTDRLAAEEDVTPPPAIVAPKLSKG